MVLCISIFKLISIPVVKIRAKFDQHKDCKRVSVCPSLPRARHAWRSEHWEAERDGGDELMARESTILIARSCQDSGSCGDSGHVERKWPANNARHTDIRSPTLQGRVTERVEITRPESTALFWFITQPVLVVSYRRFRTTSWSHLQPVGCPETPVRNYHYSLCNSPEERSSLLHRDETMKWRIRPVFIECYTSCWLVLYTITDVSAEYTASFFRFKLYKKSKNGKCRRTIIPCNSA